MPTPTRAHLVGTDSASRSAATVNVTVDGAPLMHGGGGFGCGANLVGLPEANVSAALLFNHPAGYALDPIEILTEYAGEGAAVSPTEPRTFFPGRYVGLIPFEGFPRRLEIGEERGERYVLSDGNRHALMKLSGSVFSTADATTTIGFEPTGRYVMVDPYGIGLVSALPFEREG